MSQSVIFTTLSKEEERQQSTITLIPSENHTSVNVMRAVGSVLMNKYSEGYVGKRYYQGNVYIDTIEKAAIDYACKLFDVPHANVQPYSGSPANMAVYFALLEPGQTIMGLTLNGGGHLTHGHPSITFSGKYFTSEQFDVDHDGFIDMKAAHDLALRVRPKLITVGSTAYSRQIDWAGWATIAESVGAHLHADISHIAGLVVTGQHPSPAPHAHTIMTTTHKTLRGPRGAIIMVTRKGINKNPDLPNLIDKAVFPGLQGGPHNNVTAGIACALEEASRPSFQHYGKAVVENAKCLAAELQRAGWTIVTGGTDNHLFLVDLRPQKLSGTIAAEVLEQAGIIVNRNSIPHDTQSPFYPSGIRLGTPAVTTRGMGVKEMHHIAQLITRALMPFDGYLIPSDAAKRREYALSYRTAISTSRDLKRIAEEVAQLCQAFPAPHMQK